MHYVYVCVVHLLFVMFCLCGCCLLFVVCCLLIVCLRIIAEKSAPREEAREAPARGRADPESDVNTSGF